MEDVIRHFRILMPLVGGSVILYAPYLHFEHIYIL